MLANHPTGIVDTKDGDGNTGLIIAINRSDEQWTGFLLNKGADPNLAGKGGDTPLIAAARVGFDQAVRMAARPRREGRRDQPDGRNAADHRRPAARDADRPACSSRRRRSRQDRSLRPAIRRAIMRTRDPRARDILKLIERQEAEDRRAAKVRSPERRIDLRRRGAARPGGRSAAAPPCAAPARSGRCAASRTTAAS